MCNFLMNIENIKINKFTIIIIKISQEEMSEWISDQMHDLLGYSDTTLEKYILSMAKKAKSEN